MAGRPKASTPNKVQWAEPKIKYDWTAIAKQLRRRPGKWAVIFEQDRRSVANALRQGNIKALRPQDGYEVRTANQGEIDGVRMVTLYMRYVRPKGK